MTKPAIRSDEIQRQIQFSQCIRKLNEARHVLEGEGADIVHLNGHRHLVILSGKILENLTYVADLLDEERRS
jgi:hypothetical protein